MKKLVVAIVMTGLLLPELAYSQYRKKGEEEVRTDVQILLEEADAGHYAGSGAADSPERKCVCEGRGQRD